MEWEAAVRALAGERLPAAIVDLDALDRNIGAARDLLDGRGKTLRVASKSVRHVGLLRRILTGGGGRFRGLLCFALAEAAFLADEGFDDLLVAYPSVDAEGLAEVARRVRAGARIRLVADAPAHLAAYARAALASGTVLGVVLDLDVAYEPLGLHLGVLRSPVRTPSALVDLATAVGRTEGLRFEGIMGYEAHLAGLPDRPPGRPALGTALGALKRLAVPAVARLRRRAVDALADAGWAPALVNGGGTGSLASTLDDAAVTEVTVGSGFLCSHLFDGYRDRPFEAAAYFALAVSRVPERGVVTCLGGGYVASGAPGPDRLPLPVAPEGLRYVAAEGAGEVQTPLRVPTGGPALAVGDPVVFRHAKAGELAERFREYLLLRDGRVVAREPTYRGQGRCFL